MNYMLDTNICVFAIKKNETVLTAIKANKGGGISISSITLSELEHGIYNSAYQNKNRYALANFLSIITVLPYDSRAAGEYGILRADLQKRGCLIGNMDMLIAAHAKSLNLILVTNNTREFGRVQGLTISDWSNHSADV